MDWRRRTALQLGCLLGLSWRRAVAGPDRRRVHAFLGPDSDQQQVIVDALQKRFPGLTTSQGASSASRITGAVAYLAIGPSALNAAIGASLDAPLISLFTSRQGFVRATIGGATPQRATAIYAEASPAQQMRLVAALYRRTVTVGALISEQSAFMVPLLQKAAQENRLEIEVVRAEAGATLSRNLVRLAGATALLIFPDASLYTPASLRELLESTYRRRQPVIGFSEGLVNAGTLASAYSSIDDTLAQLQVMVDAVADGRVPEPQYPRYWRVAINDSVARSLDVVVDDAVRQMGERP